MFLQQLGRGLRRAKDKAVLTALDFVGHHRKEFRFDQRFRAMTGSTRSALERDIEQGFPFLPAGTQIVLDRQSQKLVLDNQTAVPQQEENTQLQRAAEVNPVLQGSYNYDPKQFDRFLEGNTADENAALKEIAARIVAQQLAAEPAPAALDVTLPERGSVLEFARSVQVDGERPMAIDLKLKPDRAGFSWIGILLCLALGAMFMLRSSSSRARRG